MLKQGRNEDLFVIYDKDNNIKLRGETTQYEFLQANMVEGDTYYWGCEVAFNANKDWKEPEQSTPMSEEDMDSVWLTLTAQRNNITEEELRNILENRRLAEQQN